MQPTLSSASAASFEPAPVAARWSVAEIEAIFALPFNDLLARAHQVHRAHHPPNAVQLSTLVSIKTGGCPEDCAYCPQAARYHTGVASAALLPLSTVIATAAAAKAAGATRFCMGAAWRGPRQRDLEPVLAMVRGVKALGLETCATLGMLKPGQAEALKQAGLDYYNHNLDTAPEFYGEIITTRAYRDRLETLGRVRAAGIHVCCGGIVGMGESRAERAGLIAQLANLEPYPESVPINNLVQVEGTPLYGTEPIDPLEFVRTVAVARITMPRAMVRLSAGRRELGDGIQALCFFAGANSVFYGDKLLTTGNPEVAADRALFRRLGLSAQEVGAYSGA
ncbi:MAG TPA: biotin synthase BioB [Casimicrobiaceae bacterium]|jgi:biotin synthase|nr:biotin synthase BioB [Casimicrobiaceae bacterium]